LCIHDATRQPHHVSDEVDPIATASSILPLVVLNHVSNTE
jgi:hypothetical protein